MSNALSTEELQEAEYKLGNCIRVTLYPESYENEVWTGSRWYPVTKYVQELVRRSRKGQVR